MITQRRREFSCGNLAERTFRLGVREFPNVLHHANSETVNIFLFISGLLIFAHQLDHRPVRLERGASSLDDLEIFVTHYYSTLSGG